MRGEAEQARGREAGSPLTDVLLQILLVANSFIMLFPILMMALWGFKNTNEIFGKPFAIPDFSKQTQSSLHINCDEIKGICGIVKSFTSW